MAKIKVHALQQPRPGIIVYLLLSASLFLAGCPGSGGSQSVTTPAAPSDISIIMGDRIVVLGWQASAGATSYNIYLAGSPGVTKANYDSLPGGMKITGANSPYTVTGLTNGTTYYAVITAVNAAGESIESFEMQGQPLPGAGDSGNYLPLMLGNTWLSRVTVTKTGSLDETFTRTTTVSKTVTMNGATALVLSEVDSNSPGTEYEEYVLKDTNGIIELGDNETNILPGIFPYQVVQFPIPTGTAYTQVEKTGIDYGEDLDGDGINEKADVTSNVSAVSTETVTVPAGAFQNCAKEVTSTIVTVTFSKTKTSETVIGTSIQWYAQGVGIVKETTATTSSSGYSEIETEEIMSFGVN